MKNLPDNTDTSNQSPLNGALLAMLVQGSSHGYEMANRLERQLGPGWTIARPSLYRMLKRMEGEGLVRSQCGDDAGSAKVVYRPTPRAQRRVMAWMQSPVSIELGQLELQARMVVARREDLPLLLAVLHDYEHQLFAMRTSMSEGPPASLSLRAAMMKLVRDAAIQRVESELLWVDESRRAICALMGSDLAVR